MKKIRIVSNGTIFDTKVFSGEEELTGITEIEISGINVKGGPVLAKITFLMPILDIVAECESGQGVAQS